MSYHSMNYLNSGKILVGNTAKTGNAWWYDQRLEDPNNPTHFSGFIPVELVKAKLFGWEALESTKLIAYFKVGDQEIAVPVDNFKALGREDWVRDGIPEGEENGANAILSVQGKDWNPHQLRKTFIENTAKLLDGREEDLGIRTAGLLKWGRVAWMTVSVPEIMHNDNANFDYIPCLTISTSFDGSLATSWTRTLNAPVCDNTLNWELMAAGDNGKYVLKHTKNSGDRIKDVAQVIGILNEQATMMDDALNRYSAIDVTEKQFQSWLHMMVPVPDVTVKEVQVSIQGETKTVEKVSTNAMTIALKKQERLMEMWDSDPRVAPWKGTKLGIVQLWNTFNHHEGRTYTGKGFEGNKLAAKVEQIQLKSIRDGKGSFADQDKLALEAIDRVLAESVTIPVGSGTATAVLEKPKTRARRGAKTDAE